jgi:hypothetical protein
MYHWHHEGTKSKQTRVRPGSGREQSGDLVDKAVGVALNATMVVDGQFHAELLEVVPIATATAATNLLSDSLSQMATPPKFLVLRFASGRPVVGVLGSLCGRSELLLPLLSHSSKLLLGSWLATIVFTLPFALRFLVLLVPFALLIGMIGPLGCMSGRVQTLYEWTRADSV